MSNESNSNVDEFLELVQRHTLQLICHDRRFLRKRLCTFSQRFSIPCSCTALVGEHGSSGWDWPNDLWPPEPGGSACPGCAHSPWESCTCAHRYGLCHGTQAVLYLLRVNHPKQVLQGFCHLFAGWDSSSDCSTCLLFFNTIHLFKYVTVCKRVPLLAFD